ncbi:MAG: 1-acyl-sn-glycerol-3-phosphate acyltransferase [Candidatus Calescibacterium sp.]|nr:1-acyl-sn-glycerol-3-phosphate acyltransferase [Candidatus Calescibacterium sp.]
MRIIARIFLRFIGIIFTKFVFRFSIKGRETIPPSPVILAVNHHSYMDPPLVLLSFPRWRNLIFAAHMDLWNIPFLRQVLDFYGAIPVAKGVPTKSNIQKIIDLLREGKDICIFPEGGIIDKPGFSPAYRGISLIVEQTGVPVVPVYLEGTLKWIKNPWKSITLTYRDPIYWEEFINKEKESNLPRKELHIRFAQIIMNRIYNNEDGVYNEKIV